METIIETIKRNQKISKHLKPRKRIRNWEPDETMSQAISLMNPTYMAKSMRILERVRTTKLWKSVLRRAKPQLKNMINWSSLLTDYIIEMWRRGGVEPEYVVFPKDSPSENTVLKGPPK